jgi:hypothetical protein
MRNNFRYQFLVICGTVLPAAPIVTCLVLRGVEAWKLWDEMHEFTFLGAIAWLWVVVYLLASIVTVFGIDDERELKWWEFLIDAGNGVTSIILAVKCASHQIDAAHPMPYLLRFALWLAVCLIPQLMVTHAARRARTVAHHLHRQLKAQRAKASSKQVLSDARTISMNAQLGTDSGDNKILVGPQLSGVDSNHD